VAVKVGVVLVALSALLSGCGATPALTPRLEDSSAPSDYVRGLLPHESKCHPEVPVLDADEVEGRAYDEISTISATCYPGAPGACKRTLADRACELKADAVILSEPVAGGSPPGASGQSQTSLSARAVRWTGAN
jgi:hypothetical protein